MLVSNLSYVIKSTSILEHEMPNNAQYVYIRFSHVLNIMQMHYYLEKVKMQIEFDEIQIQKISF